VTIFVPLAFLFQNQKEPKNCSQSVTNVWPNVPVWVTRLQKIRFKNTLFRAGFDSPGEYIPRPSQKRRGPILKNGLRKGYDFSRLSKTYAMLFISSVPSQGLYLRKVKKLQLLDTQSYDTAINTTFHFLGCAKHSKGCTLVLTTKKSAEKPRNYLIKVSKTLEKTTAYHRLLAAGRGSNFLRGFEMSIAPWVENARVQNCRT
jgi:hypothetical protein